MPDDKNDATPKPQEKIAATAPVSAPSSPASTPAAAAVVAPSAVRHSPGAGIGAASGAGASAGWLSQGSPAGLGTSNRPAASTGVTNSPRSPDDLEEVIQVIPRRAWYAGVGALLITILIVSWSIFGEVQTLISANGILIRPGGVRDVYPDAAGNVHQIFVKQGDNLQVGDPIARIVPSTLSRDRQNVESEIATLNTQARMLRGQLSSLGVKPQARTAPVETPETDAVPAPNVPIDATGADTSTNAPVTANPDQPSAGTSLSDPATIKSTRNALAEVEKRASDLVLRLRKLDREVNAIPMLRSPLAGFVVELNITEGMDVDVRSSVVQLELSGNAGTDLLGVLYVDSADASTMVKVGMVAEIRPPGLSNETGSLIGEVSRVATFPSNKKQMLRVIGHEELVNLWLKDRLLKEVHVTLRHKSFGKDESAYEWTGLGTSAMEIPSGTICTAQIVVKKTAPIGYIFPIYHRTAR